MKSNAANRSTPSVSALSRFTLTSPGRSRCRMLGASLCVLGLWFPALSWAGPEITVEGGADIVSAYVWRGYVLADAVSLQPSATLSWSDNPLSLNVWGSAALENRDTWEEADEIDVTLDWTRDVRSMGEDWTLSLGSIAYMMPAATATHTEEIYLGVGVDAMFSPTLETFYDFDEGDCWHLRPSLEHEWTGEKFSASIMAAGGFSDANQPFGFHDAETAAALLWSTGSWTLGPTLGVSFARSVDVEESRFIAGFGCRWTSAE